jgi:hypothetical protein
MVNRVVNFAAGLRAVKRARKSAAEAVEEDATTATTRVTCRKKN